MLLASVGSINGPWVGLNPRKLEGSKQAWRGTASSLERILLYIRNADGCRRSWWVKWYVRGTRDRRTGEEVVSLAWQAASLVLSRTQLQLRYSVLLDEFAAVAVRGRPVMEALQKGAYRMKRRKEGRLLSASRHHHLRHPAGRACQEPQLALLAFLGGMSGSPRMAALFSDRPTYFGTASQGNGWNKRRTRRRAQRRKCKQRRSRCAVAAAAVAAATPAMQRSNAWCRLPVLQFCPHTAGAGALCTVDDVPPCQQATWAEPMRMHAIHLYPPC